MYAARSFSGTCLLLLAAVVAAITVASCAVAQPLPDCPDDRPGLGEECEVGVDSCASGNVCDFGFAVTDPASPSGERPVWICRTVPQVGDRCLFANALTPPSFEPGRTCPGSANDIFCSFAGICTEYPKVGQPCLPARVGLGTCAPGLTCVATGNGSTQCVTS